MWRWLLGGGVLLLLLRRRAKKASASVTASGAAQPSPSGGATPTSVPPAPGSTSAGYPEDRYPDTPSVRLDLRKLGYDISATGPHLNASAPSKDRAVVRSFQRAYNKWPSAQGRLTEDGVAGANTLNALWYAVTHGSGEQGWS